MEKNDDVCQYTHQFRIRYNAAGVATGVFVEHDGREVTITPCPPELMAAHKCIYREFVPELAEAAAE